MTFDPRIDGRTCSCGLFMYAVADDDSTDDPTTWRWVCCQCDGYDIDAEGQVVPR